MLWEVARCEAARLRGAADLAAGHCPNCQAPADDTWLDERFTWRCPECPPPSLMEMTR